MPDYNEFKLPEELIKDVHRDLIGSDHRGTAIIIQILLVIIEVFRYRGQDRLFLDMDYAPHYNLDIIMSSHMGFFTRSFDRVENSNDDNHMLTALAYFHNKFLNEIQPFADGTQRYAESLWVQ